jgi:hypothetical protein
MLTLRPTGLSPLIYRNQLDYEVIEDGRAIGRMYEDRHALPELRWFWSISVFVGYRPGTNGRTPTLEQAKARFLENKCRADRRHHN